MDKNGMRKIVLEDGSEYYGKGFGELCEKVGTLCFNTGAVGYQELITNPSVHGAFIVMTYPLIGNYGITDEDDESKAVHAGALIVREYNDLPSNFRYTKTLSEFLKKNHVPGISGIDTRALTRKLRDCGRMRAIITSAECGKDEALEKIRSTPEPANPVYEVGCREIWYSRTSNPSCNIVAVDCGIKLNTVRLLNQRGCNVTVVPHDTSAEVIIKMKPDGIVLSNGPGDPRVQTGIISLIKELRGRVPMFAIGLGAQLLALSYGARCFEMKAGHSGGNHAVRELESGRMLSVAQGHFYGIEPDSVKASGLDVTHLNVADGEIEGVSCEKDKAFGVLFYPDGASGPQDGAYLFDRFLKIAAEEKKNG